MMSPAKKRRTLYGAILGAISGTALFAVLYMVWDPNLFYAAFIPIASALGAGQMYMMREE
ncbi:MAG: hypothetical protein FWD37_05320 [Methanomassiliicoccaceae archaeon]|nr:hypothetical protein [Methanomassiliicoccaceae archaeon]